MRSQYPHIAIVIVDSLRADHLSCYGYPKKTSPCIDAIAQEGVLFRSATSQSNWTYASLYSLISGRIPSTHGATWFDQKIDSRFVTLPEVLARHGYETAIFSSFRTLTNPATFGSHFREAHTADIDSDALTKVAGWLAAKKQKPCFFIFHVGDYVHEPYFADQKYVAMFEDENSRGFRQDEIVEVMTSRRMKGEAALMRDAIRQLNLHLKRLSARQLAYLLSCYDAGIFVVDNFIGRFMEMLNEALDDCLVMITADHGQGFFEHGFYGHGLHVYEEVVRVPLIVSRRGQNISSIVEEPVQHIDILPTLLEWMAVTGEKTDGISFAPVLRREGQLRGERVAVVDCFPFISMRNKKHKLITTHFRASGERPLFQELRRNLKERDLRRLALNSYAGVMADQLFDISCDPGERLNIARRQRYLRDDLFEKIKVILEQSRKERFASSSLDMDEATARQLRNLGYM